SCLRLCYLFFFFSSRRRHTRFSRDWSSTCALPICARLACSRQSTETTVAGRSFFISTGVNQQSSAPISKERSIRKPKTWGDASRSEERRVGKECRSRWAAAQEGKKKIARRSADRTG